MKVGKIELETPQVKTSLSQCKNDCRITTRDLLDPASANWTTKKVILSILAIFRQLRSRDTKIEVLRKLTP